MLQTLRGKQKYQVTNVGVQASKVILALGVYTAEILGTQIKILGAPTLKEHLML